MRLYERFGDKGFHTSVVTTFGVDFDAYESVALPRFRGAGCNNNILVVDAGMLTYALDGASARPEHAGRHYSVGAASAAGVFHPKLYLQLGRRRGQLLIGSANMTASGLAGNLELAGLVVSSDGGGERALLGAAWNYIDRRLDHDAQTIGHQCRWMRARTPWLTDTEPAIGMVNLADGTAAALLTSDDARGIGVRFADLVGDRPVRRLTVLSPYWDEDLAALKHLIAALRPAETVVLIERDKALFPGMVLRHLTNTKVFDLKSFGGGRFIHAKAIIAETDSADHVLYGSANCTVAALGTGNFAGTNEEACLYRRLKPGAILETLDLAKVLETGVSIDPADLPAFTGETEIPLAEAITRSPGRFECHYDTLLWRPSNTAVSGGGQIELLGVSGQVLTGSLMPAAGHDSSPRRYQMSGFKERPAFARLRFSGGVSAPAVVILIDAMREVVREARGKRAESAAMQLDEETEEALWLLDIIDSLEAAETAGSDPDDPGVSRPRANGQDGEDANGEYQILSYEEFIAGRRLRSDMFPVSRNSLAGSELSLVRGFLNRILAIGDSDQHDQGDIDSAMAASLDLGDETADAEQALESGQDFTPDFTSERLSAEATRRRKSLQATATAEQIVKAIDRFNTQIRQNAENGAVTKFDILRLRAVLMILAASGQPVMRARQPGPSGRRLTSQQVLPLDDSVHAWPRLIGRTVFAFFGGNHPAIRQFRPETADDQIPDDILECWATCYWTLQAATCAAAAHKDLRSTAPMFENLSRKTYLLTGLLREELEGEAINGIIMKLSERFSARLGLDQAQVARAHAKTVNEVQAAPRSD